MQRCRYGNLTRGGPRERESSTNPNRNPPGPSSNPHPPLSPDAKERCRYGRGRHQHTVTEGGGLGIWDGWDGRPRPSQSYGREGGSGTRCPPRAEDGGGERSTEPQGTTPGIGTGRRHSEEGISEESLGTDTGERGQSWGRVHGWRNDTVDPEGGRDSDVGPRPKDLRRRQGEEPTRHYTLRRTDGPQPPARGYQLRPDSFERGPVSPSQSPLLTAPVCRLRTFDDEDFDPALFSVRTPTRTTRSPLRRPY